MATETQLEKIKQVCVRIKEGWCEYDESSPFDMPLAPIEYYREVAFKLTTLIRCDLTISETVQLIQGLLPEIEQGCLRRFNNLQTEFNESTQKQY